MSYLYITEHNVTVSFDNNCVIVKEHDEYGRHIPVETLESISILSKAQVTTQCLLECMKRGIPVSYYSFGKRNKNDEYQLRKNKKE